MAKLKVGVIFGGRSEEHPVSIKSAREVAQSLDADKYEPHWILVTQDGAWKSVTGPDDDLESPDLATAIISPDPSVKGLLVSSNDGYETVPLDVVFPVLHGKWGEDGIMQGLFELSGIPYVGCDVASSALAMDKSLAYVVVRDAGVAVPKFWIVRAGEEFDPAQLEYPVFVKPARSGSSFGVTKVNEPAHLAEAIATAREFDSKVLIEGAVVGQEIGCSILGNDTDLIAGECDRVALTHGFFRIHQETNPEGGSENSSFIVPADISPESAALVKETAKTIYAALGCRGLARVDTFLLPDGSVMLNEVNTLPGLTSYSRYPRMMAAAGYSLGNVIDRLVGLALADAK
jgi:D-alanine--(R)-lactate ligase